MINHVWGLVHHPDREWQQISQEHESISHLYLHHVLWLAAIPVVSAFFGVTEFGWSFGGQHSDKVSLANGMVLGSLFYLFILAAVAIVGCIIHWMARHIPNQPSRKECIIFAGYVATPLFLSGICAVYPVFWLCTLACVIGLAASTYLLYKGTPNFLGISHKQGFILSSSTLAIGVLVLEILLAIIVLLWTMSSEHSVVWRHFLS